MAEAAAVVGLVASIASLIELSAKVVSRLHEFTSKTKEIPESLRSLSLRLPLLTATLQRIQTQAEAGDLPNDVTKALTAVVDNTSEQISAVQHCLSQILPPDGASKLKRALKALKSLAKEDKVQQALEKIHKNNDILVLHQTTRHVDTGDRILEELSKLSVAPPASVKSFGVCLGQAPRIAPDAFVGRKDELQGPNHQLGGFEDMMEDKFMELQLRFRMHSFRSEVGLEQLLAWLNPVLTDEEYEKARDLRTPGTCNWILGQPQFHDWAFPVTSGDSMRMLWIHGPPGFGKTVLSANIVQYLRNQNPSGVACFFCISDDEAKRQPFAIVRSWVAQLIRQQNEALEAAQEIYHGKEGRLATTSDVWQLFKTICQRIPNCFFIVDGFDECAEITRSLQLSLTDNSLSFLQGLISISKEAPGKILLVSREDAIVRSQFRRLADLSPNACFEYEISISDTKDDITSFSVQTVAESLPKKTSALKEEIANEVSQRCMGMFLWIRLLRGRLNQDKNAKQLREVVEKMPTGIEKTYERDLVRIMNLDDEMDGAIAILRWILYASRPLTVREMTEALAIDVNSDCGTYPRDELPDTWDEEGINDHIRRLCGSLVELRGDGESQLLQDQTVHFVHFSVREYLLRASVINFPSFGTVSLSHTATQNDLLSQACLRYLSYNELRDDGNITHEAMQKKMDEYRFLKYAAKFWYIHARQNDEWSERLIELTNNFFEPKNCKWVLWCHVLQQEGVDITKDIDDEPINPENVSPLYYVSWLGFMHPIRYLQKQGFECNVKRVEYDGCLLAASRLGHLDMVKFLVEQQARVNAKNPKGSQPLLLAAQDGHLDVVKFLIEQEAEVNAKNTVAGTPLLFAAQNGHLDVVKLLVKQQADLDAETSDGWTPLHVAAQNGHLDIVKFLVEQQAEVNAKNTDGWTPLEIATRDGHLEVVKFLAEQQAGVALKNADGGTPLIIAARSGHLDVVKFLVEQQAEVNVKNTNRLRPLHWAAYNGHLDVIKFLVKHQAEVNAKETDEKTSLHCSAYNGHLDVVKFLVKHRAEVYAKDKNGRTPLHLAAFNGHLDTIKFLVEHRAEVNAKDANGMTSLHLTASNGHVSVVNFLVKQQAEVNVKNTHEIAPLHLAAYNGHLDAVKLLIEHNAEINAKSTAGWIPLHVAAINGHVDVVKYLVEHQAEVNAKDTKGMTTLLWAAQNGHFDLVKFLVSSKQM